MLKFISPVSTDFKQTTTKHRYQDIYECVRGSPVYLRDSTGLSLWSLSRKPYCLLAIMLKKKEQSHQDSLTSTDKNLASQEDFQNNFKLKKNNNFMC